MRVKKILRIFIPVIVLISLFSSIAFLFVKLNEESSKYRHLTSDKEKVDRQLTQVKGEVMKLKAEDQYVKNINLQNTIASIEKTYKDAVSVYERLLDLKELTKKTEKFDASFAKTLTLLSERKYASSAAELDKLKKDIEQERKTVLASFVIPQNLPAENTPPGSGYRRQVVNSDVGEFMVDIITADLNSTRVVVDTASDSDCRNDCPVLSLGDYVSRSGAYAGINGSYFCPSTYPSCSDKKNSFDTLLMNKNKTYFNSDNNVYSTVPAVIFSGSSARFVGKSLEWGRDTGVDAVIANQPLLVSNGQVAFDGGGDPKNGAKGGRSFIGASGNTAYMGVVFNATVAEAAHVIKTLGIQNALNLDSGGSTALWSGGYKAGPGRNIPNAVLFLRK